MYRLISDIDFYQLTTPGIIVISALHYNYVSIIEKNIFQLLDLMKSFIVTRNQWRFQPRKLEKDHHCWSTEENVEV